uniref:LOW QUALITY PROTEIN: membrane progesterone receptor epsilon-like n=1 Tax=Pristiophorus japonicus TaxID=55135 RepID=UPI00398ED5DA
MRECFIFSRYRRPNYTVMECLCSIFQPTNETFNFWTHFIPLFFFLHMFYNFVFNNMEVSYDHPFILPMLCFAFGVSMILAESCATHGLNCLSLQLRQTFYYMDYVALNFYGFGFAIACYYYIFPLLTVMNPTRRIWLMLPIIFNVSRIPERIWPGQFDVIGQSHQWFHLLNFLTIYDQLCYLEYGFTSLVKSPSIIPSCKEANEIG